MTQTPLAMGLDAFSRGYQEGVSAVAAVGPVGAVGGVALGILGGILGGRARRKSDHQKAAAQWEAIRPQYEAFDCSLSGDESHALREWIKEHGRGLEALMQIPMKARTFVVADRPVTHPVSPLDNRFQYNGRS